MCISAQGATLASEAANKVLPVAAPVTNEVLEILKETEKANQIKKQTNQFFGGVAK